MPKTRKTDNLRDFLTVKNATQDTADLYFYGDIVSSWWGAWEDADQYPEAVRDFLKEQDGKTLNIYINSGGGNVFAGLAIYNMLLRHKGKKTVYVDGVAASIASVIAFAGDEIVIPSNAFLMIHKPWSGLSGNADDFRKMADDLDAVEQGILNVYKAHLKEGADMDAVKEMVDSETWLNGAEAAKLFNITVSDEKTYAARLSDEQMARFCHVPKEIVNTAQADNDKKKATRIANKIKAQVVLGISKGV